ncbi:pyridoxamine 5'-phosphate oxidase family protein [Streptomyces bathyalis]|uniref:Pyridoxamine 5'-phosphate oxidase family protein n=1 Tax=Streptomyces bathyalis TaxID=2710756 RepID=A0A7T1T8T2_9ACTN|nr:pyridoxamine 5'-phosphate oxidase family protein [Streptomyces bathyalis]QPP08511.1 pyridoxamine 5'-phosphate oxidase family protein [Streptomyces bathyalis]
MRNHEPATDLDARYSAPGAEPIDWDTARDGLARAGTYWLTTVRPDGRPHVTPLIAVWYDGALHFCTGEEERKFRNLAANSHCVLTTGNSALDEGLDLVLEGDAVAVRDDERLRRLADAWVEKYGEDWRFEARDGAFHHLQGGRAVVFEVVPSTVFGFRKGDYSQTRWRFAAA